MRKAVFAFFALTFFAAGWLHAQERALGPWKQHDMSRPRPPVVDPGWPSTQDQAGKPPSDAVVLFDGKDLSAWRAEDGGPAKWKVENGYMEIVPRSGSIRSLRAFGDCQLHIEWASPVPPTGSGQGRGNSGVFLMMRYEVQILDSYDNDTYPDGQAAAVYGQYPPLVNGSRRPGEWQTYDIIFHRPRFAENGELLRPATITLFHNGVLVQDNVALSGPTEWMIRGRYTPHRDKLPILLQDHGNPVRFRNIWVRELPDPSLPENGLHPEIYLGEKELDRYVGEYQPGRLLILREGDQLFAQLAERVRFPIFAESETRFFAKSVDVQFEFDLDSKGQVRGVQVRHSGHQTELGKAR